jgi:serine/threonine protein kinase
MLTDFGISTPVDTWDSIYTMCGSAGYMAPEIYA